MKRSLLTHPIVAGQKKHLSRPYYLTTANANPANKKLPVKEIAGYYASTSE
jgi:hypothetical protein